MANSELFYKLSRGFNRNLMKLKKHSPGILVAAGVVGGVTSAVMACKATTKVNVILEKAKEDIEQINECGEKGECLAEVDGEVVPVPYSAEDHKKDLSIVYAKTGLELAKLYGPAIALGAASVACVLASHKILKKRNIALTAAYTAVERGFKEYRGRVIERFGKELDRELKYNIKQKEIEKIIKNEDGTETVVKENAETIDSTKLYSEYARAFDDGCKGWTKNAEMNLYFLRSVQNWANDKLKREGYLFLNDVYESLGFNKTAAGQIAGWYYDEEDPTGDNYVDFGIYNIYDEGCRRFVNGHERTIWLDFNVDGNILRYI